jgi:hypothetical protein
MAPGQVLRIGDCALLVIGKITGREFFNPRKSMHLEEQVDVVKPVVKQWWADFQKHGEKHMLVTGVRMGKRDSIEQGRKLAERFPDAALEALRGGIAHADDDWVKSSLVEIAGTVHGDGATKQLREYLKARDVWSRVAAARALMDRGDDSGIAATIHTWKNLPYSDDFDFGVRMLVNFLATCNRPEAVQSLGHELDQKPMSLRLDVLRELSSDTHRGDGLTPGPVATARDEVLVRTLDDKTVDYGSSGIWGDKSFSDPRLCDLAAHRLSEIWKIPDAFDLSGTIKTRDRQLVELKNIWRKKSGLAPLPLPEGKKVERVEASKIEPKLRAFLDAATTAERQAIAESIEPLGLPALPAMREALGRIKKDHPAYADLQRHAARLACTLNEVTVGPESIPPSKELLRRLEQLRGKTLAAESVVDLANSVTDTLPDGVGGVELTVERSDDDTGTRLTFILVKNELPAGAVPTGWRVNESIRVGRQDTHGTSGASSLENGAARHRWDSFARNLQNGLDSSPEKAVTARARLVLEK